MNSETIVAVYDSQTTATAAVNELRAAGVPPGAITQHARGDMMVNGETTAAPRARSFWQKLFGAEPEHAHDTAVYDRSLQNGSTVVTVQAEQQYVPKAMDILESHNPVNIDERADSYNLGQTAAADRPLAAPARDAQPINRSGDEQTMPLAEETLVVGKRAINRGTTRVRRYIVEEPVEEQVNLRRESVSIDRRPVADARPVTDANFTDKVVEVTETDEAPIITKQAHVKEEVVIHKDAADRTETVRDTIRREDVEVTKEPGASGAAASASSPANPANRVEALDERAQADKPLKR